MTIKIKAPRAWANDKYPGITSDRKCHEDYPARIVHESDWRKLMKLIRAVEDFNGNPDALWDDVEAALDALKEKKK